VLWLLAGLVAAFAVGRVLADRPGVVSRIVAATVAGAVALTWPGILHAGGAPTGYGNANATLTSLGAIGALGAARAATNDEEGWRWVGLATALVVVTFLTGSVAGSASLLLALALVAVSTFYRWPGFAIGGGMIIVVAALGLTSAIALGGDPGGMGERSELRGDLWAAAADLIQEAPLWGVGPGEFAARNPVSDDSDLRQAHNGYLQAGAEFGATGLSLVLALGAWLWALLWRLRSSGRVAQFGGAALLVVALQGTVDWIWHVPAVLVVLAVMLGEASVG